MRGGIEPGPEGLVVRPSLWAMLEAFTKWFLGLLGLFVALSMPALAESPREGPWFVWIFENVQLGFSILLPLVPAVRIAFTRYVFDAEGVRVRSQLLSTQDHKVPWEKVTALRQRRTLVDAVVGTSRIEVIAYGTRGTTLRLVGIRQTGQVRGLVAGAMRAHCSVSALERSD